MKGRLGGKAGIIGAECGERQRLGVAAAKHARGT